MALGRVRIAGGQWRGRQLEVSSGVRPTESRVREALFNIWQLMIPHCRFLDLFAGTGAVGLEAFSRGAAEVVLVDSSARSLAALRRNVAACCGGRQPAIRTLRLQLPAAPGRLPDRVDLIFADPPYRFDQHTELLTMCEQILAPEGEMVIEHSAHIQPPEQVGDLQRAEQRTYGDCWLSIFRRPSGLSPSP